ncbi:MAG: CerR family C-terminal domain-containing protein [Planctomycetes bacterium]|nr:CerR family C-terminal domain-containing protein [Planctomycetota bacterium]
MATKEFDTTRERIIDAAGEIFAQRGFDSTTVREICQSAGANVAAVNYYFGDKQRLYVEAVVRAHRWRMERAKLPEWSADTSPQQKLRDFITTFIRRVRTGPADTWHSRLVMREIGNPSAACAELVQSSIRPQFDLLTGILREILPNVTNEKELHLTTFSIVGQCLFYHFADPVVRNLLDAKEYDGLDVEKLAAHIATFSLAALKQRATRAGATR